MTFRITLQLGDYVTKLLLLAHMTALACAETFSSKWTYDKRRRVDDDFLRIETRCRVPSDIVKRFHCGTERIDLYSTAEILQDHGDHLEGTLGFMV